MAGFCCFPPPRPPTPSPLAVLGVGVIHTDNLYDTLISHLGISITLVSPDSWWPYSVWSPERQNRFLVSLIPLKFPCSFHTNSFHMSQNPMLPSFYSFPFNPTPISSPQIIFFQVKPFSPSQRRLLPPLQPAPPSCSLIHPYRPSRDPICVQISRANSLSLASFLSLLRTIKISQEPLLLKNNNKVKE